MEPDTLVGERHIDVGYRQKVDPIQTGGGKATPGRYFLTFGQVIATFDPGKSGVSKAGNAYTIGPSVKVQPNFTIASSEDGSDEHAGEALDKFYELSSAAARAYDRKSKTFVERNFSTLSGALDLMGLPFPEDGNVDAILALAESLSGLTTPEAVYLTLAGAVPKEWGAFAYKGYFKMANGEGVNLNEKAFRRDRESASMKLADYKANGGTWAGVGYIVNYETDPTWTLDRPAVNTPHLTVFARLAPTDDAWKPK